MIASGTTAAARDQQLRPLTSYLATSPGGAESVAIIVHATPVDVPFVMAMPVLRDVAALIVGPVLARAIARRFADGQDGGAGSGGMP